MNYKFRKKPVVIEAFQMTEARRYDNTEWPEWLNRAWNGQRNHLGSLQPFWDGRQADGSLPPDLEIITPEGAMRVLWDDYIIRGVQGELYPCKRDIFAATYEEVVP